MARKYYIKFFCDDHEVEDWNKITAKGDDPAMASLSNIIEFPSIDSLPVDFNDFDCRDKYRVNDDEFSIIVYVPPE